MNILFMICGRAGSKGLKNKNLKKMNGIPLVYYTLAAIRLYQEAHPEYEISVALNTDSQELIDLITSQTMVTEIYVVQRKEVLAGDCVAKVDVIQDTYKECKERLGMIDLVVDLDLTSPMRRLCDIENAIDEMCCNKVLDLVYSVVESRRSPYFNMVEKKADGSYQKVCASSFVARQQAPDVYELNASIYVYRSTFLDEVIDKTILEYQCGIVRMQDYLVLDIDSEDDFLMMELLMQYFAKQNHELRIVFERAQSVMEKERDKNVFETMQ